MTKQELEALLHEIRDLPVDDFAVAGRVATITAMISAEFDRLRGADEPSADARDAARYRYLRDDHAYEPEEQAVRGGSDLDDLCDAGNAENREAPRNE